MNTTKSAHRVLESVRFGMALVALAVAGQACAAPAPGDEMGTGEGAVKIDGRSNSPLEPGVYDSDNDMVAIANSADRQYVSVVISRPGESVVMCPAVMADIAASRVSVTKGDCALELTTSGDGKTLTVTGKLNSPKGSKAYSAKFVRRAKDALVGTYVPSVAPLRAQGDVKLTIESSEDTALTFSLTLGNRIVAKHARTTPFNFGAFEGVTGYETTMFLGATNGCWVSLSVHRHDRRFAISLNQAGAVTDPAQCLDASFLDKPQ